MLPGCHRHLIMQRPCPPTVKEKPTSLRHMNIYCILYSCILCPTLVLPFFGAYFTKYYERCSYDNVSSFSALVTLLASQLNLLLSSILK